MGWRDRVLERLFGVEIRRRVDLARRETDAGFGAGSRSLTSGERDRFAYDRVEMLRQAIEAWRVNPLARRIVELTTQYVVGGGISVTCKHPATADFLRRFWNHPLNRMPVRLVEWCDELTRTGNLFVLLSTDEAGMSYVRALPAADIDRIESRPNDIEQALRFYPKPGIENPDPPPFTAYDSERPQGCASETGRDEGRFQAVMLHYAINRPVGAQWGESDLAPVLRWLARYANWLEDRARLNRFRTAFLYVVRARFASEAERITRQQSLNANPPGPGSILVTDESESWDVISPKLESQDAGSDGLALKKMIASGAGLPLHFLAEPESATRTTAEAAGGPTYRHFEQRQQFFLWMVEDLLRATLQRRSLVERRVEPDAVISVRGTDISARDNVALGLAATYMMSVMGQLRDRRLVDDRELLRLVYRFAGEPTDVEAALEEGRKAPAPLAPPHRPRYAPQAPRAVKVDPETGENKSQ